jgi:AcrR family transcriptional regulator
MKNNRAEKITPHWPVRSDGRARFQSLMAAVAALLADQGPSEITIQTIAARAHVPKASVYGFFPSVEAALLAQAHVYLREFRELAREPVDGAQTWQEAWRGAAARARKVYVNDMAKMRLLLGADIPQDVQTAGQSYMADMARAVVTLFGRTGVAPFPQLAEICTHAIEINGMFWRQSFQRSATISESHFEEGLKASVAYLATYLPWAVPVSDRDAP